MELSPREVREGLLQEVAGEPRLAPSEGAWDGATWAKVRACTKPCGVVTKGSPRKARACRPLEDFGFYSECDEQPLGRGGPWYAVVFREQESGQGDRLEGCRGGGRRHGLN